MNTRNVSLATCGIIWILVGLRIGSRGLNWLQPYFENPDWHLWLLGLSLIIGLAKALTVLRKTVNKRVEKIEIIDDAAINYLIGWLKLFGTGGFIIISLMVAMGFGLRYAREFLNADPNNIFGFIYLGIGIALIASSAFYFKAIGKN